MIRIINKENQAKGNFNNGVQTGLWKYYNMDGTIDGTEEY